MEPSDNIIEDAIRLAVRRMYSSSARDTLTVNIIRSQVETEGGLDAGFLKAGAWKQKSKDIVKAEHEKLQHLQRQDEVPASSQPTPAKLKSPPVKKTTAEPSKKINPDSAKKGTKRSSIGDKVQPHKRQKQQDTLISDGEDSSLTSINDSPGESEDGYTSDVPKPKKAERNTPKPPIMQEVKHRASLKDNNKHATMKELEKEKNSKTKARNDGGVADDVTDKIGKKDVDGMESDSAMSIVLDEAPKRKTKNNPSTKAKPNIPVTKSSKPSTSLSPDEELLKTLQGQLVKCGIRKIWGVILKDYGSDTKAKIRHLKGMLKDVGMDGRFSEARAKEIKEARELMEDLEAVKEGEAKWGMARESRSKAKKGEKKMAKHDDENDEEATKSANEEPPPRIARAKMDLAFLGDEESDSDD